MKNWDAAIIGAGVIGLSLGWRLRQSGLRVLIIEKGEPGREASYAAGGMIAHCDPHNRPELAALIDASGDMYPAFVEEVIEDSGESPDLRRQGTIAFFDGKESPRCCEARSLRDEELNRLEPHVKLGGRAYFLPESSVDPRALGSALFKAAKRRDVDFVTGSPATKIEIEDGRAVGVRTANSHYPANIVVNCAGAWASQLVPLGIPTHPVKGQILCVVPQPGIHHDGPLIEHVVRAPEVYIIPRSDGRILLGATLEDAGYDKRVDADTVHRLHEAAANVAPVIGEMRIHDAWAGLRPGSPDGLPIIGETSLPGYFAATGHYRDGIMLAPITAHVVNQLLTGCAVDFDLGPFSPLRFS